MSLGMDTTTIVAPQLRAWELLGELAVCGQKSAILSDTQSLLRCVVGVVRSHLLCSWGFLVLQTIAGNYVHESWGLDDGQCEQLLGHDFQESIDDAISLSLSYQEVIVGRLLLGGASSAETVLIPSFLTALRNQFDLLVALQRREAQHQQALTAFSVKTTFHTDGFLQADQIEVLPQLIAQALPGDVLYAGVLFVVSEDGSLAPIALHGLGTVIRAPGRGLATLIAQKRTTLFVEDYRVYERVSYPDSQQVYASVGVPLFVHGEIIGVLLLFRTQPGLQFNVHDVEQLELFARSMTLVVHNAQLLARQQQRGRELFVLYENSKMISSTLQVEPMLTRVAENAALAIGADRCTIQLIDPNDPATLYEAAVYQREGVAGSTTLRYRIVTYRSVVTLLRSGEPLHLSGSAEQDDRDVTELLSFFGLRSALLLALKLKSRTVGLLNIGYLDERHSFSDAEVYLAQTLANQVAAAIINAQLYSAEQRRTNELEKLQEIGQRLGSDLGLDETLEAIIEGIQSLVAFDGSEICLYDATNQVLRVARHQGIEYGGSLPTAYRITDGLTGWIARHRRSLRMTDFRRPPVQPLFTTLADGTPAGSYLGVPLLMSDQLIGTLELMTVSLNGFSAADERLLTIIAGQAAQGIANAQRYEQVDEHLRSRLQQLKALQRISRQLTATLYLHDILDFALEEALRATSATQGYIALRGYIAQRETFALEEEELSNTSPPHRYIVLRQGDEDDTVRVIAAAGYVEQDREGLLNQAVRGSAIIAAGAMQNGEPVLVDELVIDDRLGMIGPMAAAALVVPIFYEDQVIGVVNLHSMSPRAFDHDALEFVRALADQAAVAIGNARRFNEQWRQREILQQRTSLLNEVLSIGQVLRADRSLEEVLEQIAFSVVEAARFRAMVFTLVDPDAPSMMRTIAGAGLPLAELERLREGHFPLELVHRFLDPRFRMGRCFFVPNDMMHEITAGSTISIFVNTAVTDERAPGEWQAGDALFIPLYSTGARLIGLMSVDDPFDRQRPTRRSVEPLEIFADQAAIAIENAGLLREARAQAEQMTALYQVSATTASTLDLDDLLDRVYREIVGYLGVPSLFFIATYDSQRSQIFFELFRREDRILSSHHKTTHIKAGLSGWTIDTGETVHIRNWATEHGNLPASLQQLDIEVSSWVGIPLRSQNQIIGVLSVQSFQPYAFSDRDVQFLSTLANQLAVALENARLFHERERRIAELALINRIGRITSSTLDVAEMLGQLYDGLVESLPIDAFFGFVYHSDRNEISTELEIDEGQRSLAYRPVPLSPGSLSEWIVTHRQPLLFQDLREEGATQGFTIYNFGTTTRLSASWLGVPLLVGEGEVVGVLSVQSYTPNRYGERELAFMTTVASQVALSIQNARLFSERERQIAELDALGRIGRVTSSTLDLRPMVEGLNYVVREVLAAESVSLTLFDHKRNLARLLLIDRDAIVLDTERELSPELTSGTLAGWIVNNSRPLRLDDIEETVLRFPDIQPMFVGDDQDRVQSYLGIPILAHDGSPIGALGIGSRALAAFSARDEGFLVSVGAQVSLGVQNAQLFTQAQEQVEQLGLLNRVSSVAAATLQIDEIFQAATDAMVRATGASRALMLLSEQLDDTIFGDGESSESHFLLPMRSPTALWLQEHQQPLVAFDAQTDIRLIPLHQLFRAMGVRSITLVPLSVGDALIGAVALHTVGRHQHFSDQALELCQTIANQTATAIQNARLFSEAQGSAIALRHKVGELSTLLEAASVLSSSLKPSEVLDMLMEVVGRQLVVNTVALWTIGDDGHLTPAAMLNIPHEVAQRMRVPIGSGLTGRVAATSQPLVVADVVSEGSSLYPVFNSEHHLNSFMGVPVIYREQTIGVLSVMTTQYREFSSDEVLLLAGMADQAAIALENAHLFIERERRITELTALNNISQTINATLELDELLIDLHSGIGEVLDISDSFIGLYEKTTGQLFFKVVWEHGKPSNQYTTIVIDSDSYIISQVILERRPILLRTRSEIEALSTNLPTEREERQVSSWLTVPIIQGDEVLGVLNVQSYVANAYDEDDLRFLTTVASQAATVIANARLFTERERRLREVSAIKDIGSAITSTLDIQDVLERLHAELGRVIDVSTSFIGLYDAGLNTLSYPVAFDRGTPIEFAPRVVGEGVNHWVITHQQSLLLNTEAEYRTFYRIARPFETRIGIPERHEQSYLVVPIISGDAVLGVINIQSYERYAYNQDDLQFVSTVANHAAIAINNARMFQERGRRIEELATFNEIGQQFSAASRLDDLVELIYRQTSRLLDTTNFYMALYNPRTSEVTFPLLYEHGERLSETPEISEGGLTYYVLKTREPLLLQGPNLADQLVERGIIAVGNWSKSWLGVPMIAADQAIGVMGIQDYERENAYSEDDKRLFMTIASWGAIALQNAYLLGETRQSVQELTALYEISVALAGTLDTAEVLHIVASSAVELLKVDGCAVFLINAQGQFVQQVFLDMSHSEGFQDTIPIRAEGLTQQLLESDHPLAFTDASSFFDEGSPQHQIGLRGALGAVIGSREQPIGVIWLGTRQPRDWQEREVSLLSILANQTGQALESARLFQSEQARRLAADTLRDVAQKLTSVLAQDEILSLILDQLARVIPYDTASLMLRKHDRLWIAATRGFDDTTRAVVEQLSFNLADDTNLEQIIQTRQPLALVDAQAAPNFIPVEGTEHIHGWIGAPLLLDDEVIGMLTVDSETIGAYGEEDAQLAFALVSQAAQAIRNARLFDEVRRFAAELEQRVIERTAALADANLQLSAEKERLQVVHAITLELNASLDIEETLTKTLGLASKAMDVSRGSIMLYDQQQQVLVCRAVLGNDGDVQATNIPITFAQGTGLVGWVMEHQQAICIPNVRKDKRWVVEEGRASEVRSVVAVPLMTQDGPLGVLMLTSPKIEHFSQEQLQLLTTIANEVTIVIHNAELYSYINDLASRLSELLEQQREETSRSQAILQSVTEGVIVLDEHQRIVLFNPAAEQVLGIPAPFALRQELAHLCEFSDVNMSARRAELIYNGLHSGLLAINERGKSHSRMLELSSPMQSIALNFAAVVGPDNVPYGSVAVLRDVTREIEADRAKRDFISSVSHELRTPLTSIKGYVDLLLLGAAGPIGEGQLSFLSVVKNNANRLMDLINDILEIGRIDADKIKLNFEQVIVANIFHDVLQTMRAEIERKSLDVVVDVQEDLPSVTADPKRMTQVIMNMVSNAVKYTYPEGQVALRAYMNPASMLQVDVEDNGVGISLEQQQHLFRRFYRADNPLRDEAGGTGLGLSIAKSMVELHGGEMWVKSDTGKGSVFSFIVPITHLVSIDADDDDSE